MSRSDKQRARLDAVESQLEARLVEELKLVAHGQNAHFFTTVEFNPFALPEHMLPAVTAELSSEASEAIAIREALGEPVVGSIGEVFRDALRRANDIENEQRLGPERHAADLLTKLAALAARRH